MVIIYNSLCFYFSLTICVLIDSINSNKNKQKKKESNCIEYSLFDITFDHHPQQGFIT